MRLAGKRPFSKGVPEGPGRKTSLYNEFRCCGNNKVSR